MTPDPDCTLLNLLVTLQTVCSLLLDYSILGLVYARFSSPTLRAASIRFSRSLYMSLVSGHLVLTTRLTNVRRQNVLNPAVRLLLALEDAAASAEETAAGESHPHGCPLHFMVPILPGALCPCMRSPRMMSFA